MHDIVARYEYSNNYYLKNILRLSHKYLFIIDIISKLTVSSVFLYANITYGYSFVMVNHCDNQE